MKTCRLLIFLFSSSNLIFAQQFSPTTASLTTDVFRTGKVGVGYSTVPLFGSNSFVVNGNSSFTGNMGLGISTPISKLQLATGDLYLNTGNLFVSTPPKPPVIIEGVNAYGYYSNKGLEISNNNYSVISMNRADGTLFSALDIAMAGGTSWFAVNSKKGDIVIKGSTLGNFIFANEAGGTLKFATTTDASTDALKYATTKTRMTIDRFGNVGIGMNEAVLNSTDKLAVNGLIHAKEVKVDLIGWPDYVFENNYKLPTLQEVEKHIKLNKHLPNVACANDIERNGLELGAMVKSQQEKIEELTLYIIEINKQLQVLKKIIKK